MIPSVIDPATFLFVAQCLNQLCHQEYFLGGKGGRCVGLTTLPPSCADSLEISESVTVRVWMMY